MEIYEFQIARAFAKEIRVAQPRLSNVIAVGQPLPKELAFAIVARFPEMSLDFLWRGKSTGLTSLELLKSYGICHGHQEQMFGADEQVRGVGLSDQEAASALGAVLNHRWPFHARAP